MELLFLVWTNHKISTSPVYDSVGYSIKCSRVIC